jgi:hypothetical protein
MARVEGGFAMRHALAFRQSALGAMITELIGFVLPQTGTFADDDERGADVSIS